MLDAVSATPEFDRRAAGILLISHVLLARSSSRLDLGSARPVLRGIGVLKLETRDRQMPDWQNAHEVTHSIGDTPQWKCVLM